MFTLGYFRGNTRRTVQDMGAQILKDARETADARERAAAKAAAIQTLDTARQVDVREWKWLSGV